jgi:hypothetical protein
MSDNTTMAIRANANRRGPNTGQPWQRGTRRTRRGDARPTEHRKIERRRRRERLRGCAQENDGAYAGRSSAARTAHTGIKQSRAGRLNEIRAPSAEVPGRRPSTWKLQRRAQERNAATMAELEQALGAQFEPQEGAELGPS